MLSPQQIAEAAALLAKARETRKPLAEFPATCRPSTNEDGYAIQDAVAAATGEAIGGYKAIAPKDGAPTRGPLYARMIRATPTRYPAAAVRPCGVEAEVAFRCTRDLPARAAEYGREEVAAALEACAAIEVVSTRFADHSKLSVFERLADNNLNGGFVHGPAVADWRKLDLPNLHVVLEVNGKTIVDHNGGHPTGDPLGVAVALANMLRSGPGLKQGQFITCGTYTGLRFLEPGDVCVVRFDGLGEVQVGFVP
jgi:2-keto-4-pentenoate hydratase